MTRELLVRKAIPTAAQEVAAFRLGVEKLLILIDREGVVAIKFAAVEAQVEDSSGSYVVTGRDCCPLVGRFFSD